MVLSSALPRSANAGVVGAGTNEDQTRAWVPLSGVVSTHRNS
jgi:hypothetical protein